MCAMLVGVMSMRPVCVIGLGLIGGSLLRDLHAKGWPVFGFNRSPSAVKQACDEGFDASSCLEDTLQRAEREGALIVLATPMPAIPSMLDAVMEHAPSCGITDVVSVKTEVYDLVRERGLQDRYVGGHPMAGTANSGWEAAHEGLFQGAAWVVTFDQAAEDPEGVSEQWVGLWRDVATVASAVGAEVIPARVGVHDAAVARISHLPHVLAEALAIVGDNGGALALSLAAGSFRDGTRVAGTVPSLVRAMCETNNVALLAALDETIDLLVDARANLAGEESSVEELVDAGYRSRVRYEARAGEARSGASAGGSNRPVLRVKPGAPKWVSQLEQAEALGARVDVF